MTSPIALALLINHESRTTFALDRPGPRTSATPDPKPSLVARFAERFRRRHTTHAGAAA